MYLTNETALVVLGVIVLMLLGEAVRLVRDMVRGTEPAPATDPYCGCPCCPCRFRSQSGGAG